MTKGLNSYDRKRKREVRRRNHIARDLGSPKYQQRIKQGRPKRQPPEVSEWSDEINGQE